MDPSSFSRYVMLQDVFFFNFLLEGEHLAYSEVLTAMDQFFLFFF